MIAALPDLLRRNAERTPARAALRHKRGGIWRETSWREFAESVRKLAAALSASGLQRGQRVALDLPSGPAWIVAELAVQAAGASVSAGAGLSLDAAAIAALPPSARELPESSPAELAFDSLTHAELLAAARRLPAIDGRDELICLRSPARREEQIASVVAFLDAGATLNFPESEATRLADLREIGPHALHAPAAFWADLHALVEAKRARASPLKRLAWRTLMPGNPLSAPLLYRPLKDRLGLSRVRSAVALGSPLASAPLQFFRAIGVPLQAEAS